MSIRDDAVNLIKQYIGVSVSSDRAKYIELLGPGEAKAMQDYFCNPKTSGCALVVRGLWRLLGLDDKRVNPNYVFGKAIVWLVQIARSKKAWVICKKGLCPEIGDFVLIGGDKFKDGGVEHVYTVTSCAADEDGFILTSVDGGQKDKSGQQAIFERRRRWVLRNGSYWDVSSQGSDPGANAVGGRRVMGWGNIEKIFG